MNEIMNVMPTFLQPSTYSEFENFAKLISESDFVSKEYKGKPGNVMIALQMGYELGIQPMQALQNISVINGRCCIWGDLLIALVRSKTVCKYVKEWTEGTIRDNTATAYCEVMRGTEIILRSFSIDQARRAGLTSKQGPWQQYPERMLTMRARGFALRDAFPDALQGLILAEEAHDHPREVETIGESKTYASTTEKLIANLGTAKHISIPEDAIIQSDPANGITVEAEVMSEVSLAEQLTILIDDKAVPIEVIQKWLSKSGVAKLSDMSDEDLTKCIAFVHEKY